MLSSAASTAETTRVPRPRVETSRGAPYRERDQRPWATTESNRHRYDEPGRGDSNDDTQRGFGRCPDHQPYDGSGRSGSGESRGGRPADSCVHGAQE